MVCFCWGPGGWWGPEVWGAQNFALFSPLPPSFSFFLSLSLSGGLLVDSKTCTSGGPGLQTPPTFHERTPRERKITKMRAGKGKKKERKKEGGPSEGSREGDENAQNTNTHQHTHTDVACLSRIRFFDLSNVVFLSRIFVFQNVCPVPLRFFSSRYRGVS